MTLTASQTQGKKPSNTLRINGSLCAGSSNWLAAGRKAMWAKNIPPTQMIAASRCSVSAMDMGTS